MNLNYLISLDFSEFIYSTSILWQFCYMLSQFSIKKASSLVKLAYQLTNKYQSINVFVYVTLYGEEFDTPLSSNVQSQYCIMYTFSSQVTCPTTCSASAEVSLSLYLYKIELNNCMCYAFLNLVHMSNNDSQRSDLKWNFCKYYQF